MLKKTTSLRDGMLLEIAHQAHTRKRREKPYLIVISSAEPASMRLWRITVLDTALFDPTRIFNDGDEFPELFFINYINEGSMRILSE